MHSVVGGGEMKRLVAAESTYSRPHVVHRQSATLFLPFGDPGVEDVQSSMRWSLLRFEEELGSVVAGLEAWFPMAIARI